MVNLADHNKLDFEWTDGIVAILGPGRRPIGAGFLAGGGLIVTCDHVLEQAGWRMGDWDKAVLLRFEATGGWAEAFVQQECYRQRVEGDVAVLGLQGEMPAEANILPLASSASSVGTKVATFGYPKDYPEGLHGAGETRGLVTLGDFDRLQLSSEETTKGFSGGPVWNLEKRMVIGMVVSGRQADELGRFPYTWFAIPAETLVAICEQLELTEPAQDNDRLASSAPILRPSLHDEQYQIALQWDGKRRLRGFDLSGRNLACLNLSGADLAGANLHGADLHKSDLSGADLSGAELQHANLWRTNLTDAQLLARPNLFHTELNEANLYRANMFAANLHGALLRRADLRKATVIADLSRADLSGADLRGTNLKGATQLIWATLTGVRYDGKTKWPEGFDPQAFGAILSKSEE